ncbi:MAG: M23 family metallopeptidase [Lachnospiraceae bacterium]|nr:M23 family metallopeptidase [Lachnospiraceae bacterium]
MKKNKFTEFFKGKGYYMLLFVGVIAIAAVALIGSQFSSNQNTEDQEYVDLNDTDTDIAAADDDKTAENNPVSEGIANNASDSTNDTAANDVATQDVASNEVEYEDYSAETGDSTEQAQATDSEEVAQAEDAAVETAGSVVQPDNSAAIGALSFKADDGLLWPVQGNVIMNYSMDHTIYFATLMQYKCNPAIILDAEVGTEVKAAADGIITEIVENEETGYTITMNIGNNYNLVYGQLNKDSVSLKVGDSVNEGDVIGTISEPTKYYSVEGSNLFFEVTENDQTVNPMLYLR